MGKYYSELIDRQIEKIEDPQIRLVCHLLREYAEIQAGTWSEIMKEKANNSIKGSK